MASGPSLANKVQFLFGTALFLIVASTLATPWALTERLVYQSQLEVSRQLAEAWLESPTRTISGGGIPIQVVDADAIDPSGSAFESEALRRLEADPSMEELFQQVDDGDSIVYRYARGLRGASWRGVAVAAGLDASPSDLDPNGLGGLLLVERPSPLAAGQLLSSRIYLVAVGVAAVGVAILLFSFILKRVILGPVRRLRDTADRVEQGDYSVRADIRTGDDFEQLAESFNRMLDETERSAARLRGVNEALDLKVTELSEANIGLYESNRFKSEFLANVSHELKTPLNSIIGFAELLEELAEREEDADPKRARYLQNIIESGRRLLEMISELLEMAKIEAGRVELSIAPISPAELLEGRRAIRRPQAEAKRIEIEVQIDSSIPVIETDAGKLQQILFNFLSNAVKFSPRESVVILSAEVFRRSDGSDGVRLRVTDHGPGIPPDLQETIFEKFRQADASHTRTHGGTGLGLAICRELATLLGAEVSLSSRVGQGSTFIVEMPLTWRSQELQPLLES
ncbi:MAG: HAMP domain-containing sensor histidine kinase [Planctomycetota bacterium]|nr:HAMP domain-containing sensor histidine kinase [Planctomycetota bacterium]